MRIKIDTEKKLVAIDDQVNVKELLGLLKIIFPNDWETITIQMMGLSYTTTYAYPNSFLTVDTAPTITCDTTK